MKEHSKLGNDHEEKLSWKHVPRAAMRHHDQAAKGHRETARTLRKAKGEVDRKIQKLQDASSKGYKHHEGGHLADKMLQTADRATKSASVSREGMDKMNSLVDARLNGERATSNSARRKNYISTAKQASHDSKAL
jgi:hypothetical protein